MKEKIHSKENRIKLILSEFKDEESWLGDDPTTSQAERFNFRSLHRLMKFAIKAEKPDFLQIQMKMEEIITLDGMSEYRKPAYAALRRIMEVRKNLLYMDGMIIDNLFQGNIVPVSADMLRRDENFTESKKVVRMTNQELDNMILDRIRQHNIEENDE